MSYSKYVLVCKSCTDIYQYVLIRTCTYQYVQFCLILSRCTGFQMNQQQFDPGREQGPWPLGTPARPYPTPIRPAPPPGRHRPARHSRTRITVAHPTMCPDRAATRDASLSTTASLEAGTKQSVVALRWPGRKVGWGRDRSCYGLAFETCVGSRA